MTSIKKWCKVLGELCIVSLALLGTCNLFNQVQNALSMASKTYLSLFKGVHQALADSHWLLTNTKAQPTCMVELTPSFPPP